MSWPRLLEELLGRARRPAATRLAERWTTWAHRLVEGRARADAAGAGPPMTLLAPGGPRWAVDHRSWLGHRLELAVRLLHAQAPATTRARPGEQSTYGPSTPPETSSQRTGRAAGGATGPALGLPLGPQLVLRSAAPSPHRALGDVASGGAAPEQVPAVDVPANDLVGLRVVEQRRVAGAEKRTVRRLVEQRRAVRSGSLMVRRLVERHRRVLEPSRGGRASTAAGLRASGDSAATAGTAGVDPQTGWALPVAGGSPALVVAASAASVAAPAPGTRDAEPHWSADRVTPASIDLERLADQVVRHIDRRIVAHRERVGRI